MASDPMQYEALLSDQEKNAFSDFLNQIANGDNVAMPSQFLSQISSPSMNSSATTTTIQPTSGGGGGSSSSNTYYPSYSDSRPLSLNFQSPSSAAMYIGAEPPSPPTPIIKDEPDPYPYPQESSSPTAKPKRKKSAPKPKVAGVLPRKAANSKGKQAEADGLLTEEEKKANHIASEQKRRHNIRVGFDQLVQLVPTLNQCHRSEALILQKTLEYLHELINTKSDLKARVRTLKVALGEMAPNEEVESDVEQELLS